MDSPGCKKFKELFETYKKFKGKPGFAEVIQALPCAVGCSLADVSDNVSMHKAEFCGTKIASPSASIFARIAWSFINIYFMFF